MAFSRKSELMLLSLRDLVRMSLFGELELPSYQRIPDWKSSKKLDFLNDLKDSGIFGSIILLDSYSGIRGRSSGSPRYHIIDGARRIDAVLDAFGYHTLAGSASSLQFDLLANRFIAARKGVGAATRFPGGRLLDPAFVDALEDELLASIAAGTTKMGGASAAKNLRKIEAILDLRLPAYIVEDSGPAFAVFDELKSKGQPLRSICPNGYPDCPRRYRPARSFDRASLVGQNGLACVRPGMPLTIPFSDTTQKTSYATVFAGTDLDCRVTLVPGSVVNALAIDLRQLRAYLSEVVSRANVVLDLPPEIAFNRDYVRSAAEELEESANRLVEEDGFYDEKVLAKIRQILSELIPTLNRATASMARPPRALLVRKLDFAGVFIDRDIDLGPILCRAGIFVKDDLSEKDRKRVVDHELAHAYFRANKSMLLDCPWIDEGLAEWCSGYLAGSFLPVSRFAFYDFLEVLAPLPLSDLQAVATHWLQGDVPATWWCAFVKDRKLPPPPVVKIVQQVPNRTVPSAKSPPASP